MNADVLGQIIDAVFAALEAKATKPGLRILLEALHAMAKGAIPEILSILSPSLKAKK